jgi:hypothetical protein
MQTPDGHRLTYEVSHERWHAKLSGDDIFEGVKVRLRGETGVSWTFDISNPCAMLGHEPPEPMILVNVYYGDWDAFTQFPEFFAQLAERKPATLTEVIAILDALGAEDETVRQRPARLRR